MTAWLWLCALALLFAGCEEEPQSTTTESSERGAPRTEAAADKAPPSSSEGLRCSDFMSEEEAQAAGLEAYDATAQADRRTVGVHCVPPAAAPVSLTIFRGLQIQSMISGAQEAEGVETIEGPSIGQSTYWYTSSGLFGVFFRSDNGNYTGSLVGDDKDALAEVAAKVAPHLNKP